MNVSKAPVPRAGAFYLFENPYITLYQIRNANDKFSSLYILQGTAEKGRDTTLLCLNKYQQKDFLI